MKQGVDQQAIPIKALKEENKRMEIELNLAKDIQLRMIPDGNPPIVAEENIDFYAKLIPAREVGGDFYDYYWVDDHKLGFVVGDVSGKGVAAGFMMAICKALLKSRAAADSSPASILTHVNNQMAAQNPDYMFVTVFMAVLDTQTQTLVYSNAGHNPTFIRHQDGTLLKLSDLHGPVVAAMEGIEYGETTVQLTKGDVVFAYTDGITEAHNSANELFSEERLQQALERPFKSPKEIVERMFMNILMFERGEEQFDDLTALCIQLK
jgi:sigma-B regulation protein RsbU (phosphoserine phosphatase)